MERKSRGWIAGVLALIAVALMWYFTPNYTEQIDSLTSTINTLKDQINALNALVDGNGNINPENQMALTVANVYKSVVSIRTSTGSGSGVVVYKTASDIWIATNYHVVQGNTGVDGKANRVRLMHWNDNIMSGSYNANDFTIQYGTVQSLPYNIGQKEDIAIIKATAEPGYPINVNFPVASFRSTTHAPGEKVIAMGWSLGMSTLITDGVAGFILKDSAQFNRTETNLIRHNAEINPGNSGGPLWDINGNLLGLNTFTAMTEWDVYEGDPLDEWWTWDETDFFASEAAAGMYYAVNVMHIDAALDNLIAAYTSVF